MKLQSSPKGWCLSPCLCVSTPEFRWGYIYLQACKTASAMCQLLYGWQVLTVPLLLYSLGWMYVCIILLCFILYIFKLWQIIWIKIYHLNHKAYSSVALSTFTFLCNHQHHPPPELSSFSSIGHSVPKKHQLPFPTSPQSLAVTILLSVSTKGRYQVQVASQSLSFVTGYCYHSIMTSRFICVIAGVRIFFLLEAE